MSSIKWRKMAADKIKIEVDTEEADKWLRSVRKSFPLLTKNGENRTRRK